MFFISNKYSDITLGDFWRVKNYYPDMYNKKGVSAIIVNTNKGKELFNIINNDLIYKECKLEEIVSSNPSLKVSGKKPNRREEFFNELDSLSINELVGKYFLSSYIIKKVLNKCEK